MKAWREIIGTLLILGMCILAAPGAASNVRAGTNIRCGHSDANLEKAAEMALDRNPALALVHADIRTEP
jgi:hypothetical protein